MTRHVVVDRPDDSDRVVRGSIWRTDTDYVLSPLAGRIFNIGCWPIAEGLDVIPGRARM
jgi:hypothetical protein